MMKIDEFNANEQIRSEIAQLAAKLIAEEGLEYASAKRRAAKQLLGKHKINGHILPDNKQIEQEVREYHALFFADTQPQRLYHLRCIALEFMQSIAHFNPYLVGAVQNGTAGKHADIYLHLYTDNCKEVAIFLLNKGLQFEVTEHAEIRDTSLECFSFMYREEGIHLLNFDQDAIRRNEKFERTNIAGLLALLNRESNRESNEPAGASTLEASDLFATKTA